MVLHNGKDSIFKWWPIVAFFTTQLLIAGVIYGDIRARLTAIEAILRSNRYIERDEVDQMVRAGESAHRELQRQIDDLKNRR